MSTNRFHKAAQDGFEVKDILKEATKKDCNSRDEQGMTPTLYASFHGHYNVLTLLCARGGNPDKADFFGNTALHLAAAQGHIEIVRFLIKFGVNIYAMDIDKRTPQELAGLNNRNDILQLLDKYRGDLEADEKMIRKVRSMKEKAKKDVDKIMKKNHKYIEHRNTSHIEKERKFLSKSTFINTLKLRSRSGSLTNLVQSEQNLPRSSFSALVGSGTVSKNTFALGTVQRRALLKNKSNALDDSEFTISEIEDGKRTTRSIKGSRRNSEVMFSGALQNSPARVENIFMEAEDALDNTINCGGTLMRSRSQPDFMQQLTDNNASIFMRPGIGSFAFRKSITNAMQALSVNDTPNNRESPETSRIDIVVDDDDLMDSDYSYDDLSNNPLECFLFAWGLGEYVSRFEDQKIDLDMLLILTENDLKSLGLPLGPYRKLVTAIAERKACLNNSNEMNDGRI